MEPTIDLSGSFSRKLVTQNVVEYESDLERGLAPTGIIVLASCGFSLSSDGSF
jgi:hypothetical protein